MIDVYYPYIEEKHVWSELRYSLRSLEMYLKIPFRVVIVGDKPKWVKNVYHIPVAPIVDGAENCLRDTLNKLNTYLNHSNTADKFIRMYDDVYLLDDVNDSHFDIARAMYQFKDMPIKAGIWWEQLKRTAQALANVGYSTETHFPELFEKEKMKEVFEFYDPIKNKLLVSTLYYNTYFFTEQILPQNKYVGSGAKFYGSNAINSFNFSPADNVEQCCTDKLFLNHNDAGLTENVKNYLIKKFPNKSIYEADI